MSQEKLVLTIVEAVTGLTAQTHDLLLAGILDMLRIKGVIDNGDIVRFIAKMLAHGPLMPSAPMSEQWNDRLTELALRLEVSPEELIAYAKRPLDS
ncbi:MAG TPA: hypothetical protein VM659_28725 [Dongiaceae bacterium]|nr:hypothetical protein [Dongiaceae bacterium]